MLANLSKIQVIDISLRKMAKIKEMKALRMVEREPVTTMSGGRSATTKWTTEKKYLRTLPKGWNKKEKEEIIEVFTGKARFTTLWTKVGLLIIRLRS